MEMVSLVEEIVSENLNAEENLPAFLLPLVMVDILPVSFTCTAWQKQKNKSKQKKVGFLLALLHSLLPSTRMALQLEV